MTLDEEWNLFKIINDLAFYWSIKTLLEKE